MSPARKHSPNTSRVADELCWRSPNCSYTSLVALLSRSWPLKRWLVSARDTHSYGGISKLHWKQTCPKQQLLCKRLPFWPAASAKKSGLCPFTLIYRFGLLVVWEVSIIPSVPPEGTSPSPGSNRGSSLPHPHYLTLPLTPELLWTTSACSLPGKVQGWLWRWFSPVISPSQQNEQDLTTLDALYLIGQPNLSINFLHQDGAPGAGCQTIPSLLLPSPSPVMSLWASVRVRDFSWGVGTTRESELTGNKRKHGSTIKLDQ